MAEWLRTLCFARHRQENPPETLSFTPKNEKGHSQHEKSKTDLYDTLLVIFEELLQNLSKENQIGILLAGKARVNDPFMHLRLMIRREIFFCRRSVQHEAFLRFTSFPASQLLSKLFTVVCDVSLHSFALSEPAAQHFFHYSFFFSVNFAVLLRKFFQFAFFFLN